MKALHAFGTRLAETWRERLPEMCQRGAMLEIGESPDIANRTVYDRAVGRLRDARVVLPTFDELADPSRLPDRVVAGLREVDPDAADPRNLLRVHWWNDASRRGRAPVPEHVVLPESLTGVSAPIVVALGNRFPMIGAHKVLAAYACLVPRLVTGRFDPTVQRAVWPSTGNYCRGGVAISRLLGCRGVAVLPEQMSAERFQWLERWVAEPDDVVRTPGCESNVKEIYDRCAELEKDDRNVILNQFAEFGNYLAHLACTGAALAAIHESLRAQRSGLRLAAFVSATGSAGTIAAGDALKQRYGAKIVAAEAVECPTLLENGFGDHNIQGIGDKHVPLIHNVMNTDLVVGVSDRATDQLGVAFRRPEGREYLRTQRRVPAVVVDHLDDFGLSSLCNVVAAIKTARHLGLGPDDAVYTVATDGDAMYASEHARALERDFGGRCDAAAAARTHERWMLGTDTDHVLPLDARERRRIFNLGYFTWVEQLGVPLEDFVARREPGFWTGLRARVWGWNERITEFNARTGVRERT
jgi:cysteine synthase